MHSMQQSPANQEQAVRQFLRKYLDRAKDETTLNSILREIGAYYEADRACIFELDQARRVIRNTFEQCREGIAAEIDQLQNIPAQSLDGWFKAFDAQGEFLISSLSQEYQPGSKTYDLLAPRGIESLMAAPITAHGEVVGFLAVCNPQSDASVLLLSVAASTCYSEIVSGRMMREKLEATNRALVDRMRIIQSMSEAYVSVYDFDLLSGTFNELSAPDRVHTQIGASGNTAERMDYFCDHMVVPAHREEMREFVELSTLDARLRSSRMITREYLSAVNLSQVPGQQSVWAECAFIEGARTPEGKLSHVVFTVRIIHDSKVRELESIKKLQDAMEIAGALSSDYPDVFLLDLAGDTSVTIKRQGITIPEEQRTIRRSYNDAWKSYISKHVLEEDRDALCAAIAIGNVKQALESSNAYSFSYRVLGSDADIHHYQASFFRFYSQAKAKDQMILGFRCIDAIVEEEQRNRAIQEEQLRIITALSQEYSSLFKIDAETRQMTLYRTDGISFDPAVLEDLMSLGDYEIILGKYIDVFVSPEDRERLRESIRLPVLLEKVPEVGLFKLGFRRILDGIISYYEMNLAKTDSPSGTVTFILALRNVDEEMRRQLKQTRRMEAQREIIEGLGSEFHSVFLLDPEQDTVSFFRAAKEHDASTKHRLAIHQNRWSEIMQAYAQEDVTEQSRAEYLEKLSLAYIRARDQDYSVNIEVQNRGELHYLQLRVAYVRDADGKRVVVIGTRNVDDLILKERQQEIALKAAFDAAEAASRAKSDFLSHMSHDIRTPMNGIIGMTAIAAAHLDDRERVQDCLNKTAQASKHLLSLINEVLDMSKIESGRVDLMEEDFNLSELIDSLISMTSAQIAEHRHHLSVNITNVTHEAVVGDSLRIQKVLTNLMGNAVKYTPDGGNITLSIAEKPSLHPKVACYEIVFEDNGIGMSEAFQKQIFEPFTRSDDELVHQVQGTGLGMAISRNIVRMMGGDIKVESRLGVGSRFTVTIYLKLQDTEIVPYNQFADLDVLVADDDELSLESCCAILNDLGMKAEGVSSGAEMVERVIARHQRSRDYAVCIIDWKMPEMDGIATTRAIRQAVGQEVPIIIISAYDWSDIEQEARAAGATAFISKPLFRSRLVKTFNAVVECDEPAASETPFDHLETMNLTGRRILLVEDNDLNAEIATEILAMTGLTVERVTDGVEAVDQLAACRDAYYDLIFMDIQMPRMNGHDASRAIRAMDRRYCQQVPIIAMTANAFAEDVLAAKTAGMNEHIAKPVDMKALAKILKKWIC